MRIPFINRRGSFLVLDGFIAGHRLVMEIVLREEC